MSHVPTETLPVLPCGHRTRHTQRIGCCSGCGLLFSSDSAFEQHRKGGKCTTPEQAGLIPKPSPTAPEETVWSWPGHFDRPSRGEDPPDTPVEP